jgi:hypothetical protein
VGVAGEDEVDAQPRIEAGDQVGVVGDHHARHLGGHAAQRPVRIGAPLPEVPYSDEGEAGVAAGDQPVLVLEDGDAGPPQPGAGARGPGPVIVVAEHGVDPEGRAEGGEGPGRRRGVGVPPLHVVAAEEDDVRVLRQGAPHRPREEGRVGVGPVVGVGEEGDAEAGQAGAEARHGDAGGGHLDPARLEEPRPGEEAQRPGHEGADPEPPSSRAGHGPQHGASVRRPCGARVESARRRSGPPPRGAPPE